jgi:hypothetical protein
MSQRNSEYARQPRDLYETPHWVTEALIPHIRNITSVWEPACGSGKITDVLAAYDKDVVSTDIETGYDFLKMPNETSAAIITNPPFLLAEKFINHALSLTAREKGIVIMLLPINFDAAKGRNYLFGACQPFRKKIILTRRIVWFKRVDGIREAPSENHAWYVWDWKHSGPPTIAYHYE